MNLFEKATEFAYGNKRAALCIVVDISGSTPRKAGAKMIVVDDGTTHGNIFGTIGGGAIEHLVRREAIDAIRARCPRLLETSLKNELGMCCGGQMKIFIEPIEKKPQLICFGAGHIAQALCPLASILGYEVTVVDGRQDLLTNDAFKKARQHFNDTSHFSFSAMPFSDETYIVIATHDHDLDQKIVEGVSTMPFRYAALVGSQRKALMTKKRLIARGFSDEKINRIICPAGLSINASTPSEIAVSIAAQMTLVKNEAIRTSGNRCSSGHEREILLPESTVHI